MNAHVAPPANVVRFPPRLRVVPKWVFSTSALDTLLSADTIDARQHAAGLAYGAERFVLDRLCPTMTRRFGARWIGCGRRWGRFPS